MRVLTSAPVLVLCAALAACTSQELGADLDEGGFGNPTAQNLGVQTGQMEVQIDLARRFAREVDSTVTFAFNSASLDSAARANLDRQADWIRQFPEVRFKVYGHTDLVGSNEYNQNLGRRRADAVVAYLGQRGISRSRLEALVSLGETQPLVVTQQPELRNRRTVTEVSGFVSSHPTVMDGKYAAVIYREYIVSAGPSTSLGTIAAQP